MAAARSSAAVDGVGIAHSTRHTAGGKKKHARRRHHKRKAHRPSASAPTPIVYQATSCGPGLYPGPLPSEVNTQAAVSDARTLIATIRLPASATPARTAPVGSGFTGATTNCATYPDAVGDYEYWVDDQDLSEAIRSVEASPPTGSSLSGGQASYQGAAHVSAGVTFAFAPVSGVSTVRELVVSGVPLSAGTTALQVSTQVQPLVQRPASEVVPSGVTTVLIEFQDDVYSDGSNQETTQTVTVTEPSEVDGLVALTDWLPLEQPGAPSGCPGESDLVTVSFENAAGDTLAQAETSGCPDVSFSINGQAQPSLGDPGEYENDLASAYDPAAN
jgi:hypothetical protein